jgi:hypothetical protein
VNVLYGHARDYTSARSENLLLEGRDAVARSLQPEEVLRVAVRDAMFVGGAYW